MSPVRRTNAAGCSHSRRMKSASFFSARTPMSPNVSPAPGSNRLCPGWSQLRLHPPPEPRHPGLNQRCTLPARPCRCCWRRRGCLCPHRRLRSHLRRSLALSPSLCLTATLSLSLSQLASCFSIYCLSSFIGSLISWCFCPLVFHICLHHYLSFFSSSSSSPPPRFPPFSQAAGLRTIN